MVTVPEGNRSPGPTEGRTEKDGFTYVTVEFGGNKTEIDAGREPALTDREAVGASPRIRERRARRFSPDGPEPGDPAAE
jgi:hypothetical protein